jgi:hypothetical protein
MIVLVMLFVDTLIHQDSTILNLQGYIFIFKVFHHIHAYQYGQMFLNRL